MENTISLKEPIKKLDEMFIKFNNHFYYDKLEKPIITICPDNKRSSYGWFTTWRAWQDGKGAGYYEINITADYLNEAYEHICGTLLHEMVHLSNLKEGIHDTTRGGTYHNHCFKETAEKHGLIIERDSKYGWTITKLQPDALAWIKATFDPEWVSLHRENPRKNNGHKKSSSRKYVCPRCGLIARTTRDAEIICKVCRVDLEEQKSKN